MCCCSKVFHSQGSKYRGCCQDIQTLVADEVGIRSQGCRESHSSFFFGDEVDAERVLMGQHWNYDKHLVSLRRLEKNVPMKDLEFNRTLIWVQLHDLPLGDMNPCSAYEIGKVIGEVQPGFTKWDSQDGSSFMCIRVRVDTSKPLCHGRKICLEDGSVSQVRFKYERLPNLCYWCGLMTHADKDCDLWVRSRGNLTAKDQQFGGQLRASASLPKKSTVIKVEGFQREKVRDDRPHSDDTVSNASDELGLNRLNVAPIGPVQSEDKQEVGMDTAENLVVKPCNYKNDFQEVLDEIDMGLSKFDGQNTVEPLSSMTGLAIPSDDSNSPKVQHSLVTEGVTPLGGQIRCWKRLARELATTMKEGGPFSAKCGFQEGMEVEDDLLPAKKHCASTKSFETVEAVEQPRRDQ